jgi:hypothetical protein
LRSYGQCHDNRERPLKDFVADSDAPARKKIGQRYGVAAIREKTRKSKNGDSD